MFPCIIALSLFFTTPNLISAENTSLPVDRSQARGYLDRLYEHHASTYGTESVQPEHEAFIRSIMTDLGYTRPLIIRKMNRYAMSIFSRTNAFVWLDCYLFVGESFFKELSVEEQRFLIGHELAHGMYYHTTTILLVTLAAKLIAAGVGIATARKLHALEVNPPLACALGLIVCIAIEAAGTFGTKMIERRNEITADYISATRLNAKDGGIAFLKTAERYNVYDYSKLLNRLLEGHPSPAQRIALLENIITPNS